MDRHECTGKLVTFCGLDGCGKTTLINKLNNYLSDMSINTFLTKQPTAEMRNNHIFRIFQDQEDKEGYDYRSLSLLAAADRLQHNNKIIVPELNKGKIVISDRYFYSCLANLQARGYTNDLWIYDIVKHVPLPDISFFLDIDVEKAVGRVRNRPKEKDSYIDMELQYKLRESYIKIANEIDGVIISTDVSVEDSFNKVKYYIDKLLF